MADETRDISAVGNAVRLVGDFGFVPGMSQIIDGKYVSGFVHAGIGIASRLLLAPPVGIALWALTAANSYSRTVRGKNVIEFKESDKEQISEAIAVLNAQENKSDDVREAIATLTKVLNKAGKA